MLLLLLLLNSGDSSAAELKRRFDSGVGGHTPQRLVVVVAVADTSRDLLAVLLENDRPHWNLAAVDHRAVLVEQPPPLVLTSNERSAGDTAATTTVMVVATI